MENIIGTADLKSLFHLCHRVYQHGPAGRPSMLSFSWDCMQGLEVEETPSSTARHWRNTLTLLVFHLHLVLEWEDNLHNTNVMQIKCSMLNAGQSLQSNTNILFCSPAQQCLIPSLHREQETSTEQEIWCSAHSVRHRYIYQLSLDLGCKAYFYFKKHQEKTSEVLTAYPPQYHSPNLQTLFWFSGVRLSEPAYSELPEKKQQNIPNKRIIAIEKHREPTRHSYQSLWFSFGMPHCGLCSYIKRWKMSQVSLILSLMRQDKVLELECSMFQPQHWHTCSIFKAQNKTWSLPGAASSYARPIFHPSHLQLLKILSFIPDIHFTSPSSWPHSKSRHFLTFTTCLGRPCSSFPTKASLFPHAQTPFPSNFGH